MEYFAVQVWTGHEKDLVQALNKGKLPDDTWQVFAPSRMIPLRKRGKIKNTELVIFSGYVFMGIDGLSMPHDLRWKLRTTNYFVRILPDTANPVPIKTQDRRILAHFMSLRKPADTSKVIFDENDRIVIVEGPLKGLEAMIVKIDRRKGRAKVKLAMCENSFLVDLAFEVLIKAAKGTESEHVHS